jgi:hypothetical protein
MNTTPSPFKRRPPPFAMRLAFGLAIDGILRPSVRLMDKCGIGDRLFRGMRKQQIKDRSKNNPLKHYAPTKHDVFVGAYVKSGTNWTMQIVHQLLNHGMSEYDHIHDVVAWPTGKYFAPMHGYSVPLEDESIWRASPEKRRVIKTHFNWEDLPYSESARYIFVIRDPKDVFVSSYFFFGNGFPVPSVETWFKLFCSSDFHIGGSWAESAAGYSAQRYRSNVLILSFKAMKLDLPGTVRDIADFLDLRVGEDVIQRVCEKSSFEYMKRMGHKFDVWNLIPWRSETSMVRKGVQGGSSELLTQEKQREMDEYFTSELRRLGSDLPYEDYCDLTPLTDRAGMNARPLQRPNDRLPANLPLHR